MADVVAQQSCKPVGDSEAKQITEPAVEPAHSSATEQAATPEPSPAFAPKPLPTAAVPEGHGERVLVTGGTGYLGCHVVRQLLESGQFHVRATVRNKTDENKVKPLTDICPESKKHLLEVFEADLDKPETWTDSAKDCEFVIHMASPFPAVAPENEDDLVKVAVEGTLNVLKAAHAARTVRRFVLTSSVVAITEGVDKRKYSEDDWSVVEKCGAYSKSKTLAEKAAWDFVKELPENEKFELVVINPGYIMGPTLTTAGATSFEVVKRLLHRDMPVLPRLHFNVVDVRDAALAHVHALTLPGIAGSRHILAPHGVWVKDIAVVLSKEFKKQGYNVPTMQVPFFFVWVKAQFDPTVKMILPHINVVQEFDSCRMRDALLVVPRDFKDTVIDMANSLIEKEIVMKKVQRKPSRRLSLRRFRSKREERKGETAGPSGQAPAESGPSDSSRSDKEEAATATTAATVNEPPLAGAPDQEVTAEAAGESEKGAADPPGSAENTRECGAGDAGTPAVEEESLKQEPAEAGDAPAGDSAPTSAVPQEA